MTPKELRRKTLELAYQTGNGHIASALSIVEILLAVYDHMKQGDRFILSKGHGCLAWYALLQDMGFNPALGGHPDRDPQNGIICTTGSLGHGLPMAVGMAYAKKYIGDPRQVYVLIGDGECQEGTLWESLLLIRHHKLNNLTIIVDYNRLQALSRTGHILDLGDLAMFFETMGVYTLEVEGHRIPDIKFAFQSMIQEPKVILAYTTKGKGISFMENNPVWHAKMPNDQERIQISKEL